MSNIRTQKTTHHAAASADARPPAADQSPRLGEASKPRLPEVLSKQFLQRLDEDLQLTPEQHEAIQKIINDGQNQMRKVVQDARLEIREVLTAEQRKEFDELVKRPFRKPLFGTNAPTVSPPTGRQRTVAFIFPRAARRFFSAVPS